MRASSGFAVTVQTEKGAKKAPIVGNVCMDQCMIDVTDLGARVGDPVTVFGNDTTELTLLAEHARTIPYEYLVTLSPRVKLHYRD
jgi:alanine racemase